MMINSGSLESPEPYQFALNCHVILAQSNQSYVVLIKQEYEPFLSWLYIGSYIQILKDGTKKSRLNLWLLSANPLLKYT